MLSLAGANYAFDWGLITHPKDSSGEMEGKHSRTLKLSKVPIAASVALALLLKIKNAAAALLNMRGGKRTNHLKKEPRPLSACLIHSLSLSRPQLTVGLYEFKVAVDGEGAHGEGYVNVTVKPGGLQRSLSTTCSCMFHVHSMREVHKLFL